MKMTRTIEKRKMSMPGFTAEASFSNHVSNAWVGRTSPNRNDGGVLPQFIAPRQCYFDENGNLVYCEGGRFVGPIYIM
jgi:hypothetical protein